MKVVITGGTGFLGLRLARAILERGALRGATGAPEAVDEMILFDAVTPPERPEGLDEGLPVSHIPAAPHPDGGPGSIPPVGDAHAHRRPVRGERFSHPLEVLLLVLGEKPFGHR